MEKNFLWKVTCHNHYDYKLTNRGEEAAFKVRVESPFDGVIPFGNDVEPRLNPGRSVRFRLINTPSFDPNQVVVYWTDDDGAKYEVHLNTLIAPTSVTH